MCVAVVALRGFRVYNCLWLKCCCLTLCPSCCRLLALESFAAGIACAEWHLGRYHPVLCELDAAVADALIAVGDYGNATLHLTRARDLATMALGHSHAHVAALTVTIGDLYRVRCVDC